MPIEPDYEKLNAIIPKELFRKLNGYIEDKLSSYPVDQGILEKIRNVTAETNFAHQTNEYDIDYIIGLRNDFQKNIVKIEMHDNAAIAYLKICDGRMLNRISDHLKYCKSQKKTATEKKFVELEIRKKFGLGEKFKSTDFKLMQVARIPFVEDFCFLGLEILKKLASTVSELQSQNPLLHMLYYGGYTYNENNEINQNELAEMVEKGVNAYKFNMQRGLCVSDENLSLITKFIGIVNDSDVESFMINHMVDIEEDKNIEILLAMNDKKVKSGAVNKSDNDLVDFDFVMQTQPLPRSPSAPSYNKFEETCLSLTEMMEDIIDDRYIPNAGAYRMASNMQILFYTMIETLKFWKDSWKEFDENFDASEWNLP